MFPDIYDAAPLALKVWQEFLASGTAPIDLAERALRTFCDSLIHRKGVDVVAFNDREEWRSQEALAYHSVPPKGEAPDYPEKDDAPRFIV